MELPSVAVFPPAELARRQRLFAALGELCSVRFVPGQERAPAGSDASLLLGATREEAMRRARLGAPCLAFIGGPQVSLSSASAPIQFTSTSHLPVSFRGRSLRDDTVDQCHLLTGEPGDEIMAAKGEAVLWIRRAEGAALDVVATNLPELGDDEYLLQYFSPENWMRLLPVLHFLQEFSKVARPPLRACLMFDDPNLHWTSFGYVRYRELAEHAGRHNYHVSFATVPLDAWYVHSSVARLFRENRNRLSLLIHGNNHTRNELAQGGSEDTRRGLVAQVLRRIERLERKSGLNAARVMVAPHSACTDAMAEALLRMGFDGACINRYSLRNHNSAQPWPATTGLNMAEFLGGGLPVIPRFGLVRTAVVEILQAAFLGQPIVLSGHHEDLAPGLDILEERAALINSLGAVQWGDMKSISQSNFSTRRLGNLLHVKMFSRGIGLAVPADINALQVERPWLNGTTEPLELREVADPARVIQSQPPGAVPVLAGTEINLGSVYPGSVDPRGVANPPTPLPAVVRRHLCECRDRLKPATDRFFSRR